MFRRSYGMAMAMMSAMSSVMHLRKLVPDYVFIPYRGAVKRRHTGKKYPHSSTRQQARYVRQIAAGQLRMDGIANV